MYSIVIYATWDSATGMKGSTRRTEPRWAVSPVVVSPPMAVLGEDGLPNKILGFLPIESWTSQLVISCGYHY